MVEKYKGQRLEKKGLKDEQSQSKKERETPGETNIKMINQFVELLMNNIDTDMKSKQYQTRPGKSGEKELDIIFYVERALSSCVLMK